MSQFSTQFPVSKKMSREAFINEFVNWRSSSRNSRIEESFYSENQNIFIEKNNHASFDINEKEQILYTSVQTEKYSAVYIQYIEKEKNISFITDISLVDEEGSNYNWLSFQIRNSAHTAGTRLPPINKPKFINQVIENNFGGELFLQVQNKPHYLTESDIQLAADLISGKLNCYIPIVYISLDSNNRYTLLSNDELDKLAQELAGMAHVVIEPSREFSLQLSELTNNKSVFNGYIGIYWAEGNGRNIVFSYRDCNCERIRDTIVTSVSQRRLLEICTGNSINNQYAIWQRNDKETADELLGVASDETERAINKQKKLEQDLDFAQQKLNDAEREIERLKEELKISNKSHISNNQNAVILHCEEVDLYSNEIHDLIISILEGTKNMNEGMDRRMHVLNSILKLNPSRGSGKKLKKKKLNKF